MLLQIAICKSKSDLVKLEASRLNGIFQCEPFRQESRRNIAINPNVPSPGYVDVKGQSLTTMSVLEKPELRLEGIADSELPDQMSLAQLESLLAGDNQLSAITVDVFDTIILRRAKSEVHRHALVAQAFRATIKRIAPEVTIDRRTLHWSRRQAQKLAYRARQLHGYCGEVRLTDICRRQLQLMRLPEQWIDHLIAAELDVEAQCLRPNDDLLTILATARSVGVKVYAISDTAFSAQKLEELIRRIVVAPPLDGIFSSAEENASKRGGDLFAVAASKAGFNPQQTVHIGDDYEADVQQAGRSGACTVHVPRPRSFVFARRLDGVIAAALGRVFRGANVPPDTSQTARREETPAFAFGRETLGPIVVDYAIRQWLYLDEASRDGETSVMFCARGGLLMRVAYERVLERIGVNPSCPGSPIRLHDVMVSRLVTARVALAKRSEIALLVINRELHDMAMADAMEILAAAPLNLPKIWQSPVSVKAIKEFLESPDSQEFHYHLKKQNELFALHLRKLTGSAKRLVLVDTGLYGSTVKMLQDGFPNIRWESLQLARSNYRGFDTPHFNQITGLWVQRDSYSPLNINTCILRYWHLVEGLFEPSLNSVTSFSDVDEKPVSNLEYSGWKDDLVAKSSEMFRGTLDYIDAMQEQDFRRQATVADKAWKTLKRKLIYPKSADLDVLMLGERSRDFGRTRFVSTFPNLMKPGKLKQLKSALWKAGAAVQLFPASFPFIQRVIEGSYFLRWVARRGR